MSAKKQEPSKPVNIGIGEQSCVPEDTTSWTKRVYKERALDILRAIQTSVERGVIVSTDTYDELGEVIDVLEGTYGA